MAYLSFDIKILDWVGKIHRETFPTQSKILTPQHCQRVFWKNSRKYHVLIQISPHQSCYYSIPFLCCSKLGCPTSYSCHVDSVHLYSKFESDFESKICKKTSTLIWKYMTTKHFITPEPKNKFANWFLTVLTMPFDNKTIP